jgi:HlyD family secretion protein
MRDGALKILFAAVVVGLALVITAFWLKEKRPSDELILYGNVDVRLVDIGFRVAGRVNQLFFEEGDLVRKGELMCVLDKTPYDAELRRAESSVRAAMANLNLAEILLKRREELIGVGGVSQEDLDHARASRDQLLADLQLSQANAAVNQDNLNYTEVYAPTDGIILSRVREPGTVVNPTDPVYSLSVLSPVWVRAYVSEPDLGKIYYGMPAEIVTDTKDAPIYKGQIGFISPMAEFTPKTVETTELRTDLVYRLRVYAENPDWYLKQGMPVTVKLKLKK